MDGIRDERLQILKISLGTAIVSVILIYLFKKTEASHALAITSLFFLVLYISGEVICHNAILILHLITRFIGELVSKLILVVIYIVGIGFLGSLLKIFKMNMLSKNWHENIRKESMFCNVPEISKESFWRQS